MSDLNSLLLFLDVLSTALVIFLFVGGLRSFFAARRVVIDPVFVKFSDCLVELDERITSGRNKMVATCILLLVVTILTCVLTYSYACHIGFPPHGAM
mgnify:FL=1